jgi:hypothetical protein
VAQLREPAIFSGDDVRDSRLVGLAPALQFTDAGLTPDAGPRRPWVLRSCVTLTATARLHATVSAASFHIDKAVTSRIRTGDLIHLVRTMSGGLGLSVIRDGELVVAVGAITAVPLGRGVVARIPADLIAAAEGIFRQRDPGFRLPECPLEVGVDRAVSVLCRGRRTLGAYEVFVEHGFLDGIPGTAECAAICRTGLCSPEAANASAMLLAGPGALTISNW